jgi:hypothetical protein
MVAVKNESGRELVPCSEAAEAYGCTMSYMRRLARDERVRTEEHAGIWWFDIEDVRKLASRTDGGRKKKRSQGFQAD